MSGLLFFTVLAVLLVAFFVGIRHGLKGMPLGPQVVLVVTMAVFTAAITCMFIELLLAEHAPNLRAMLY